MSEEQQQDNSSFSKAETIELLQGTIEKLQKAVNKLKREPIDYQMSMVSFENLVATTEKIASSVDEANGQKGALSEGFSSAIASLVETDLEQNAEAPESIEQSSSFSKTKTTELLEAIVQKLQEIVDRLKQEDIDYQMSMDSFENLVANTEKIASSVNKAKRQTGTSAAGFTSAIDDDELSSGQGGILGTIRSILPASLVGNLSNTALTGILVGVVVLLIAIPVFLLPHSSSKQIANTPESNKTEAIATTPPEPTPEQNFLATINQQANRAIADYSEDLIVTIKPNFIDNSLILELKDDWYNLSASNQNQIANKMLYQAEKFNFSNIEFVNAKGSLLARSPVIGKDIVILQRQK
ncbi:MAG: hypothetical protein QNJ54_05460 [Prochloraceae cyanobacterium]|nr:hypothetical protein [Prochloraceae cyanobacterium]